MSTELACGRYYGTLQDILASMSHHIQLILVGDFYQLPPVGGEAATRSINQGPDPDAIDAGGVAYTTFLQQCLDQAKLHRQNPNVPFGFKETKGKLAFQTACWRHAQLEPCVLKRIFRTSDNVLLAGMCAMRQGKQTGAEIQALVNATARTLHPRNGVVPTTLMATKSEVKALNLSELKKLDPSPFHTYISVDKVLNDAETTQGWEESARQELWNDPMFVKDDDCPAPKELELRLGTQVMLIKNEILSDEEKARVPAAERLVNGSRGVVIGFSPAPPDNDKDECVGPRRDEFEVAQRLGRHRLPGHQAAEANAAAEGNQAVEGDDQRVVLYPLVKFLNGREKVITADDFEKRIYVLGTCMRVQIPLVMAWAITIHKSQGASLDYVVADLGKCFAEGHAYVAVSRATGIDGLQIRNYAPSTVKISELVVAFYRHLEAGTLDEFLNDVPMWWASVVQHPQRIAPIRCADGSTLATWKDLYMAHHSFASFEARFPQGQALPSMAEWERRYGAISRQRMGVCYNCKETGHWARNCPRTNFSGSPLAPAAPKVPLAAKAEALCERLGLRADLPLPAVAAQAGELLGLTDEGHGLIDFLDLCHRVVFGPR